MRSVYAYSFKYINIIFILSEINEITVYTHIHINVLINKCCGLATMKINLIYLSIQQRHIYKNHANGNTHSTHTHAH